MTRAPWRSQDIPDAILGRSSRPSLPAIAASVGLDMDMDVSSLRIRCDEVYYIVHDSEGVARPKIVVWCMNLGEPWQQ